MVAGQRRGSSTAATISGTSTTYSNDPPNSTSYGPTTASPLNYIPDPWPAFGGPGPEPGAAGVYTAVISQIVPTGGGVDLPGGGDGDGNPAIAASQWDPNSFTYLFGQPTLPSDPSGLLIFSPPGDTIILPAPADATTYSLAAAGEAVFGMDFAPVAGNGAARFAPSFPVGGGPQAPGTEFATGNNPASLPAFTSETIAGPFGRNRAAAFPMTHSSTLVNYGTNGVTAATNAPPTLPGGSIISVLPAIGGAAARAADQVFLHGLGSVVAGLIANPSPMILIDDPLDAPIPGLDDNSQQNEPTPYSHNGGHPVGDPNGGGRFQSDKIDDEQRKLLEAQGNSDSERFKRDAEKAKANRFYIPTPPGDPPPLQIFEPVGEPGFWESLIPFWGSGRTAVNDFETGHPVWGTVNLALAASDVFLVRSIASAGGKLVVKSFGKLFAHEAAHEGERLAEKAAETAGKRLLTGEAEAIAKEDATAEFLHIFGDDLCFAPSTLVASEGGLKPIDSIGPRDRVRAFDFGTGQWTFAEVLMRHDNVYTGPMVKICVGDSEIETTLNHPFWVVKGAELTKRREVEERGAGDDEGLSLGGRWVLSQDVQAGDLLFSADCQYRQVVKTEQRYESQIRVINLSIAGAPFTFAVGW